MNGRPGAMVQLQLGDEDARILLEALNVYLTDFRREVAGTENSEFRHDLQRKATALERIIGELKGMAV
jgi:hypothetical protein